MFWKLLGIFKGVPKDIAILLLDVIKLIVDGIKKKKIENRDACSVVHGVIDQLPVDLNFRIFMKNFAMHYFDDRKIDLDEAIKLANLMFRLQGYGVGVKDNGEEWVISIRK